MRYLLCAVTVLVALPSTAQMANAQPTTVAQAAQPAGATVDGEVQKIDKEAGKITLKHGPSPNLDMPGMTMVFRVKDPAMLDSVKAGDKVRFAAEKAGGALTVTQMTPVK